MLVTVRTTSGTFDTQAHPGMTALALVERTIKHFDWLGSALDYEVRDMDGRLCKRDDMITDTSVFVMSVQPVDA